MMPTKEQDKQQQDLAKEAHQHRSTFISDQLMQALGRPAALYRVEVRPLWEDHYRVNVFVSADAGSTRVAQSYFLVTDEEGNILASTPKITRQY
jgi:hypothetical protein